MKPKTVLVALAAFGLLAAGCGGGRGSDDEETTTTTTAVSGDFGDLKNVCHGGTSTSSPAQGVTATEIKVGVFSDIGFTKNPEFLDAAKVFTTWCNAAGGINGRKLVAETRDSKLLEVRQRMLESCRDDFALVGGGAAFDGMGVKDRLKCLMPAFPGQVVQLENIGSDLQISIGGEDGSYDPYQGYFEYLFDAYPDSKTKVGVINGDSAITAVLGERTRQGIAARGGKIIYDALYPVTGVSDWTPFAQAIKSKGVKGLQFLGQFEQLAKLEAALTTINYKLDWIDANSNAYSPAFIKLLGKSASFQNNVVSLNGVAPVESAATNPAIKQLTDLYTQYLPQGQVTFPTVRSFSAWLLFAKAAGSCGDNLTRKCVYDAALAEKAWTGGGLQAPLDLAKPSAPKCYNVEQATADGWKAADFKPDTGIYRCDSPVLKVTGKLFAPPVTLKDVGKSLADFK